MPDASQNPSRGLLRGSEALLRTGPRAQQLLVQDFESYGGGTVAGILLHKEWENFAHFGTAALENGAYERLEGLQGKKGTFYATGLMTIDDIEDVSRYARDLVNAHF